MLLNYKTALALFVSLQWKQKLKGAFLAFIVGIWWVHQQRPLSGGAAALLWTEIFRCPGSSRCSWGEKTHINRYTFTHTTRWILLFQIWLDEPLLFYCEIKLQHIAHPAFLVRIDLFIQPKVLPRTVLCYCVKCMSWGTKKAILLFSPVIQPGENSSWTYGQSWKYVVPSFSIAPAASTLSIWIVCKVILHCSGQCTIF